MESQEYKQLKSQLDRIEKAIQNKSILSSEETWYDISDTCFKLKISKRLLQQYRDKNLLAFSQIQGKIYFKANDIQNFLEKHYNNNK